MLTFFLITSGKTLKYKVSDSFYNTVVKHHKNRYLPSVFHSIMHTLYTVNVNMILLDE